MKVQRYNFFCYQLGYLFFAEVLVDKMRKILIFKNS